MKDILDILNANSGALNLLFSLIVAVATVVYARLTATLVRETKHLREVQTEPSIEVFFRSHNECMSLLEFVVKNVGHGSAYNIQFNFSTNSDGVAAEELLGRLQKLKIANSGINLLYPGQEFCTYWTDVRQNFEDKLKTQITVVTSCKSGTGSKYENSHILDLLELEGVAKLGTPPLYAIAKSVEKLQSDVHSLASGFHKLKVDTYSADDRYQEQMEIEAFVTNTQKNKDIELT